MILVVHADAVLLNEPKSHSRVAAYIFLSEKYPKPKLDGPILTV